MADITQKSAFKRWTSHPLTLLTGVLAVVYGLLLAFGGSLDWVNGTFIMVGAIVVGVCFIASIVAAVMKR